MKNPSFIKPLSALALILIGCSAAQSEDSITSTSSYSNNETKGEGDGNGTDPGTTDPDPNGETPAEPTIPLLPAEWPLNGSHDCVNHTNAEPTIYKYKYDENTYILRENKCLNFEANFIHVLFGHDKVLIQDTGSIPQGMSKTKFTQVFPIRDTIEGIITEWLDAHPNADGTARTRDSMELLVTHTHSHGDHVGGDYQFKQANGQPFPGTRIAGLSPSAVAQFFGITNWPTEAATLDLGNRKLEVMGIPGHEGSHVAIYDHGSRLLLTGDSLYPGHLFINDWGTYRTSITRLNNWMQQKNSLTGELLRPVNYVLGTHIEKPPTAGQFYPYPSWVQDPERKLELFGSDLELLANKVQQLGPSSPHAEIFLADFSLDAQ